MANIRRKGYDIERYVFLQALQGRNERLFYQIVMNHIDELLPLIYTPTVGQACQEFAHIFRQPRGFYITPDDRGLIREIMQNWPDQDVRRPCSSAVGWFRRSRGNDSTKRPLWDPPVRPLADRVLPWLPQGPTQADKPR